MVGSVVTKVLCGVEEKNAGTRMYILLLLLMIADAVDGRRARRGIDARHSRDTHVVYTWVYHGELFHFASVSRAR